MLSGYYEHKELVENIAGYLIDTDRSLQNIMQKFKQLVRRLQVVGIQIVKFDRTLREQYGFFKMLHLQYSSMKFSNRNMTKFDVERINKPLMSPEKSGKLQLISA